MRGLIIVLFMIVSSFAQDNYSKKDIEKMIAKMVVLGFTGTSIDKNSQIYKDIEFGLGGVILFDKDPNDKTKAKNIENKAQLKKLNQQLVQNQDLFQHYLNLLPLLHSSFLQKLHHFVIFH